MRIRMDEPHREDNDMKQCDKSKDQIRNKRQRNLVHKNNKHKGGAHTPNKYERRQKHREQEWNYLY
jgi:hypothetical protein